MAIAHKRLGIMTRLLRRCPECREGKLYISKTEKNMMGVRKEYTCNHCGSICVDWKPSSGVKFLASLLRRDRQ